MKDKNREVYEKLVEELQKVNEATFTFTQNYKNIKMDNDEKILMALLVLMGEIRMSNQLLRTLLESHILESEATVERLDKLLLLANNKKVTDWFMG